MQASDKFYYQDTIPTLKYEDEWQILLPGQCPGSKIPYFNTNSITLKKKMAKQVKLDTFVLKINLMY